ncbi:hypothetical protein JL722_7038 [Aureococcus anophagefferens]|nr:hypothetical protein JL722_7038 [Aureococcus anophagefferens]
MVERDAIVVSLGESRGAEGKEPELSDEERRCEIVETFLRRDAHGGFGLFFASGGGAAVVRKVSGMWDARVSGGRRLLAPGDTVVRVGGFPTATAGDVRRQMASAETMVALTARRLIEKPKEPKPSDDLDVIASAAERTLAPPPSKIFKEGLEFSAVGACVDINRRFGTSRPNFEILSLGQFEVGAAMARELDRVGETAKTFQRGLEADESDDGGEQRSYGAAALELAAGSFATAARVVLRPEFRADVVRAAEPGGQAAKRPINVAALLAPGLLLVSRHLLPFADALRKSPLHARRRDGARCLADVEARAKHASHLAELALTLTDEDARELSEQDLEQTLLGAFARGGGADADRRRELQDVLVERETSLAKQALDMARVTVPHAGDLTALAASAERGSSRRSPRRRRSARAAGDDGAAAPPRARDAAPPPPEGPSASDEAALLQKLDMAKPPPGRVGLRRGALLQKLDMARPPSSPPPDAAVERASNVVRACARSRRELRVISREARAAGEPDDTVDAALARFDALPRPNDAVWQHETVPDADAAAYLAYDAGDDDDDDDGGGEAARRDP